MSASGDTPAKSTRRRVAEGLPRHDDIVVRGTWQHGDFEVFLHDLSVAFSAVSNDDIESEIGVWLNRLADGLGADHCTVGEFYAAERLPRFGVHWLVGNQPVPFVGPEDSWIRNSLVGGQSISIASLDEIPAKARSTRRLLEAIGIRSGLWVPLMIEGSAVGGMGLTMLSHERSWPEQILRRCRLVANVFADALLRRRVVKDIEERSRFESLVTDISARFMNVETDIDALTDEILGELGVSLRADRVTYLEIDVSKKSLMPTLQWIGDGIEQDHSIQNVDVSAQFPWLTRKITRNEPVTIDRTDQFPDDAANEQQYCENLGIQSFTMVPATLGGGVVAALALDNINSPRIWSDRIVQRLKIVAGLIASSHHRESRRQEIEMMRLFERAVSKISTAFVNLPAAEVDEKIEAGLGIVAESLGADIISLLQPHEQTGYLTTHEWISGNLETKGFKGTRVEDVFPWLADQLSQSETIIISADTEFPAEATLERAALKQAGLSTVLFVPFEVRGELAGHLAIDTVEQIPWPDEFVPQLRLFGEVLGEALNRREAEMRLQKSFNKIKELKDEIARENVYLRQEINLTHQHEEIIGDSAALRAALTKVEQVAPTDSTVLILGETGTGKELLARAIHAYSARKDKLMIKVNCAALPSSLVESELFGREKGAYTGALSRELGRFELADGSTILLDEIGELSLELQAKLLRVLQDGEFERLGSSKTRKVDVRVMAATNRDLQKEVGDKKFREDLFYRLNVFPIEVPPLRDRLEDLPQLVWAFVREYSQTMGKTIESIPRRSMELLKAYSWPGNVREVRNVIERAMIVSRGPTLEIELPGSAAPPADSPSNLAEVERRHINAIVESTGWRIRGSDGAAELLGLKPTTLEARMKKLGIERHRPT